MTSVTSQALTSDNRLDIIETVTGMGIAVDLRDWEHLTSLYEDQIVFDYVSLFGGEKERYDRSSFVKMLQGLLAWWDTTQHMITNAQIRGDIDQVEVITHVRGVHTKGERQWIVGACYTHNLRHTQQRWLIYAQKATLLYENDQGSVKADWLRTLEAV